MWLEGGCEGDGECSMRTGMWGRPDLQISIVHIREVFLHLKVFNKEGNIKNWHIKACHCGYSVMPGLEESAFRRPLGRPLLWSLRRGRHPSRSDGDEGIAIWGNVWKEHLMMFWLQGAEIDKLIDRLSKISLECLV